MLVLDISSILRYTSFMTTEKKEKIFKYLQDQIAQADFRARAYVFDENNNKNPTRNCFVRLRMFLRNFMSGQTAVRWLVITDLEVLVKRLFYLNSISKLILNKWINCIYP